MELNYFVSYSLMDEHGVASSLCPTDNTVARQYKRLIILPFQASTHLNTSLNYSEQDY